MKHLQEEELVMHFYGDLRDASAEEHLRDCAECAAEFARLGAFLEAVEGPEVPARPESYGTDVWNRIRAHLPEAEPKRATWWAWMPQRWAVGTAMALLVVVAFVAGRYYERPTPGGTPTIATQGADGGARALVAALGDHLDRSEMLLLELSNAPEGEATDISQQQEMADELIDANRLYRMTAQQNGNERLADVLDQLERALVEVKHQPSTLASNDARDLRQQIDSEGLLFKLRVLQSNARGQRTEPAVPDTDSSRKQI